MKRATLPQIYMWLLKISYGVMFVVMISWEIMQLMAFAKPPKTELELPPIPDEVIETQEIVIPDYLTTEDFSSLYTCKEETTNDTCLELTYDDAQYLMKLAVSETGNVGGSDSQLLVMEVIMNRLASEKFPNTIKDIIYADNQFAVVTNGSFQSAEPNADSHLALARLESGEDTSEGALYFEAATNSDKSWHKSNRKFLFEKFGQRYYR